MGQAKPIPVAETGNAARERAKAAAQRAGMSVAEWLNQVIQATTNHLDSTEKSLGSDHDSRVISRLSSLRSRLGDISREIALSNETSSDTVIELSLEEEVWELAEAVATLFERLSSAPQYEDLSWSSIDRQLGAIHDQVDHASRMMNPNLAPEHSWDSPSTSMLESKPVRPNLRYSTPSRERYDDHRPGGHEGYGGSDLAPHLFDRLAEIEHRLSSWHAPDYGYAQSHPSRSAHVHPAPAAPERDSRIEAIQEKLDSVIEAFDPSNLIDQVSRETAKAGEALRRSDLAVQNVESLRQAISDVVDRQSALENAYRENGAAQEIESRLDQLGRQVAEALDTPNPDIEHFAGQLRDISEAMAKTDVLNRDEFHSLKDHLFSTSNRIADTLEQMADRQAAMEKAYKSGFSTKDIETRLDHLARRVEEALGSANPDISSLSRQLNDVQRLFEASNASLQPGIDRVSNSFHDVADRLGDAIHQLAERQSALEAAYRETTSDRDIESRLVELTEGVAKVIKSPNADISALQNKLSEIQQLIENAGGGYKPALESFQNRLDGLSNMVEDIADYRQEAEAALDKRFDSLSAQLAHSFEATKPKFNELEARLDKIAGTINPAAQGGGDTREIEDRLQQLTTRLEEAYAGVENGRGSQNEDALFGKLDEIADRLEQKVASRPIVQGSETDVLAHLEELADRIDKRVSAKSVDLSSLDARLDALQRELQAGASAGAAGPEFDAMVSQLHALSDRLDSIRDNPVGQADMSHLERQIGTLSDRIEEAQENFASINGIEKSLVDLFNRIDDVESSTVEAAKQAARDAILGAQSEMGDGGTGVIDAIQSQIASLQDEAATSDKRTRQALGAVQMTLEKLVARIQSIEAGPAKPSAPSLPADVSAPEPKAKKAKGGWFRLKKKTENEADDADLANAETDAQASQGGNPHLPLEPGMNGTTSASTPLDAMEEEASEPKRAGAQLIDPPTRPNLAGDAKAQSTGNPQADFIAAARRAAQVAQSKPNFNVEADRPMVEEPEKPGILARSKSILLATITAGLFGVAAYMFVAPLISGGDDLDGTVKIEDQVPSATSPSTQSLTPQTDGIDAPTTGSTVPNIQSAPRITNPEPAPISDTQPRQVYPTVQDGNVIEASTTPSFSQPLNTASVITTDIGVPPSLPTDRVPPRLRTAALSGSPEAEFEVAVRYATGVGVERDLSRAAEWYGRAAQQGMAPAQYRLGSLYEKGQGVPRNLGTAKTWYEKGAANGNRKAMHNLAVLHAEGVTGEPDYEQAATWFRQAAERNLADSQYNLAILFARGLGVEPNLAESLKWFSIAAAAGDKDAESKRNELESQLDQETLLAARLAVQNWTPIAIDPAANDVSSPAGGWGPLPKTVTASAIGGPEPSATSSNQAVQRAQSLLDVLGYDPGPADGIIGPKTTEAIRAFERRIGRPETGQLSAELVQELSAAAN